MAPQIEWRRCDRNKRGKSFASRNSSLRGQRQTRKCPGPSRTDYPDCNEEEDTDDSSSGEKTRKTENDHDGKCNEVVV